MPQAISLTFESSVTPKARTWCEDAMRVTRFPTRAGALSIIVRAEDEPPCPGHNDYMCTQTNLLTGEVIVTLRTNAEVGPTNTSGLGATVSEEELREFFISSFIHELGHAFTFMHMTISDEDKTRAAGFFTRSDKTGEPPRRGTLADWNPLDKPWEDRIQEAVAEFFKDTYLLENDRWSDNRTNWTFDQTKFAEFIDWVQVTTCPPVAS